MVPKHVAFAPGNKWGLAPFIPKASISSAYLRDCTACSEQSEGIFFAPRNARSAFITVFSLCSLRRARGEKKWPVPIFSGDA